MDQYRIERLSEFAGDDVENANLWPLVLAGAMVVAAGAHAEADKQKISICAAFANKQATDPVAGVDPDGAAFVFTNDGKIVELSPAKIVSRKIVPAAEGSVETIVYKTLVPKDGVYRGGAPSELKPIRRQLVVKRDGGGRLLSVAKVNDLDEELKKRSELAKEGLGNPRPIINATENVFLQTDRGCLLSQRVSHEMAEARSKSVAKVTYDLSFCNAIAPELKQASEERIAGNGTLLPRAIKAYESRRADLAKANQVFKAAPSDENAGGKKENPEIAAGLLVSSCRQMAWELSDLVPGAAAPGPDAGAESPTVLERILTPTRPVR